MDEEKKLEIMKECCRFSKCSANICPLDTDSHLRNRLESDEKCGVAKSVRLKIGHKYGLEKLGLTDREWAAKKRFESLSAEEKEKLARRGSLALKKLNCGAVQKQRSEDNSNIV